MEEYTHLDVYYGRITDVYYGIKYPPGYVLWKNIPLNVHYGRIYPPEFVLWKNIPPECVYVVYTHGVLQEYPQREYLHI